MVSTDIVKVLDLVNSNDPVLAGECFFYCVEDGSNIRKLNTTNTILSLSNREEAVVVVVGHFVHQAIFHGLSSTIVNSVFSTLGKKSHAP